MSSEKIRVLIVDDSAFARKVLREVLGSDSEIEVIGYARDGLDALEKITELRPDVITLDLVMPDLDGIGFLRSFTKETLPRIVIVSVSSSESELAIEALHLGAIDIVTKPTASATDRLYDMSAELISKVKAAANSKPKIQNTSASHSFKAGVQYNSKIKLIVLGTSTGGPQAITEIFKSLPEDLPVPLVIALHIPSGYTEPLAVRVTKTSSLKLVEAYDGMELVSGQAVIVPGGKHLTIKAKDDKIYAQVSFEPFNTLYHPSIDLLFESAADQLGSGVLGVVLTGMGTDGTIGSQSIRNAGGVIVAESESSCVVYGMPRSVIESGSANYQDRLENIPSIMIKIISDS